ncbi:eukaryotic translation initiation factor 2A [Carabus blaptoides fortunei]
MVFSSNGKYFAWANSISIKIVLTENWSVVGEIIRPKACNIIFSPNETYLMSWEPFTVSNASPQGSPNMHIYRTDNWEIVKSFIYKKQTNWEMQWSSDETICARMVNNDVTFYEGGNFERIIHRINFAKIGAFSLAPGSSPLHVLCYTPGLQGQPALCRLFKYPSFDVQHSLANKSFFQADKVDFYWNRKGTSALLMTSTDVDKTGASYYGKQTLHYIAVNGNSAMVAFSKDGPIYSVAWSPKSTEFCVIYGFMPSKATIFNLKCEPIFEFGTAPRNSRKIINRCEAPDTTLLEWSPDGEHFITATTAPRLRIGNGYKIWHYSGSLMHEHSASNQEELYNVCWQSYATHIFKEPVINTKPIEGIETSQPQASKQAYRPPCARGKPHVKFSLHDEDDNQQEKVNVSKAALKQKKKREAKKNKKQETTDHDVQNKNITTDKTPSNVNVTLTGNPEKDKKIKNIKKKLDAIHNLKEQQAAGKPLEINQIAKIKGEDDLLNELKCLQI